MAREADVDLSLDDLRAVTAFDLACAERVIVLFERAAPADDRPREALEAARAFVDGGPRTKAQRLTALAAHRAAKQVTGAASCAAMSAGDAAASAYLHPLADAEQVGHILRGPAYAALALSQDPDDPLPLPDAIATVLSLSNDRMREVLARYPRVPHPIGSGTTWRAVMAELDRRLREGSFA